MSLRPYHSQISKRSRELTIIPVKGCVLYDSAGQTSECSIVEELNFKVDFKS